MISLAFHPVQSRTMPEVGIVVSVMIALTLCCYPTTHTSRTKVDLQHSFRTLG